MEPPLNVKSSVTSRKSFATLPSTSSRRWPPPLPAAPSRRATSFLTVKLSPSVTNDSVAQRPCSNHHSSVWNHQEFTRLPTTPSRSATLTSVRTCTPTTSCPEVPPCTPVSPTECKRRSPLLPQARSRSSLHQSANPLYGSEVPSSLLSPPSNRCG